MAFGHVVSYFSVNKKRNMFSFIFVENKTENMFGTCICFQKLALTTHEGWPLGIATGGEQ